MTKSETITNIIRIKCEMQSTLIRHNIKLLSPDDEQAEKLPANIIKDGFQWLKKIYDTEYEEYKKVWKLLPEVTWTRYFAWECFDDHTETIALRKALFNLKRALTNRNRPDFFKRVKYERFFRDKKKTKRIK